jgi:hypothetical protein
LANMPPPGEFRVLASQIPTDKRMDRNGGFSFRRESVTWRRRDSSRIRNSLRGPIREEGP